MYIALAVLRLNDRKKTTVMYVPEPVGMICFYTVPSYEMS